MLAGFPPPLTPPDRPLPPELAGSSSHGYNCRCVATHFGLDPARYGEVPACSLTEAEYHALLVEAVNVQGVAKRLAAARDVAGAQRQYARMRQLAHRLDRTDLDLAAVSDLATVCYSMRRSAQRAAVRRSRLDRLRRDHQGHRPLRTVRRAADDRRFTRDRRTRAHLTVHGGG